MAVVAMLVVVAMALIVVGLWRLWVGLLGWHGLLWHLKGRCAGSGRFIAQTALYDFVQLATV